MRGGSSGLGTATVAAVLAAGGTALVLDLTAPTAELAYANGRPVRPADEAAVRDIVEANGGRLDGQRGELSVTLADLPRPQWVHHVDVVDRPR